MEPGTQLAHYGIISALGKGGMGEVWRAKDTKLGREVAIKTLPPEFAQNEERLARFEREAKLLASLNHPNIAAIYGLEEHERSRFLVLELVEGDTLADRMKRGAISVEESLKLALQIAEALEAAHEKGVIHRDLKPANIKVTPDGKVKVLDFGLAKAVANLGTDLSQLPTQSEPMTMEGAIQGTMVYMSPQQLRGESVDVQADIWAFGCVLFEMLTGQRTFGGQTHSDVIAGVLRADPDWNLLPQNLHLRIRLLLERCLQKNATDRCHSIADARADIHRVVTDTSGGMEELLVLAKPQPKRVWVGAIVLAAIITGVVVWTLKPEAPPDAPQPVRFDHELPAGQAFAGTGRLAITISPDGRDIVYNTSRGLYRLSAEQFDARPIAEAGAANFSPMFSPNGEWVGYWSAVNGAFQKVPVNGGASVHLASALGNPPGASWGPDDSIVYPEGGMLMRVAGAGGDPGPVLSFGASAATFPQVLPDGNAVLFQDADRIMVRSFDEEEAKALLTGIGARYLPTTRHIVYGLDGSLYAQVFDLANLELVGDSPKIVVEGVMMGATAQFAVSDSGTLAYVSGDADRSGEPPRSLLWVDRNGENETYLSALPRAYANPHISPDGTQAVVDARDLGWDILVWDFARETLTQITFGSDSDAYPAWTPDGERIAFHSRRLDDDGMYWAAANNTGSVEAILLDEDGGGEIGTPSFFTPDGTALVFGEAAHPDTGFNIGRVALDGDSEVEWLLNGEFNEMNAALSPDGNWMAYESDELGEFQIYVVSFPNVSDSKTRISTNGGIHPVWAGEELFYLERVGSAARLMTTTFETDPAFAHDNPQPLFDWPYTIASGHPYDVSADGQRFLVTTLADAPVPKINIVVNWFEELRELVPVP